VFKPSTDSKGFGFGGKKILSFGFGVPLGDVRSRGIFYFYGKFYPALSANPFCPFFAQVFFKTRLSTEFFEPLIGFLAYLEPNLWLTKQKLVKISTQQTLSWSALHPYYMWL